MGINDDCSPLCLQCYSDQLLTEQHFLVERLEL